MYVYAPVFLESVHHVDGCLHALLQAYANSVQQVCRPLVESSRRVPRLSFFVFFRGARVLCASSYVLAAQCASRSSIPYALHVVT